MSDLVGNQNCWFSHGKARLVLGQEFLGLNPTSVVLCPCDSLTDSHSTG